MSPPLSSTAKLIGLWKLTSLAPLLKDKLMASDTPPELKRSALVALARLNAGHDVILKLSADAAQPYAVRLGAVEALTLNDGANASKAALALMPQAKTEEEMRGLLAPFLVKATRTKLLVTALGETPCNKESADLATRALITMGRNEPELSVVLNRILGRTGVVMPYDAQWVSSLGNEARVAGNPAKGDEIWHRPALNCIACHQIKGLGGIIGPQLDAVGRGMPIELIVEAVMWPQRQIKEGYVATTVVMKDGRTIIGYKNKESEAELTIRDMASGALTTLQKSQMQSHTEAGSLMPDGLTVSLSREELRDLIAYLASLGKEK